MILNFALLLGLIGLNDARSSMNDPSASTQNNAGDGINESCPKNNGMTDAARLMFIDKHNSYRSLVAKGQAEDPLGTNGYAPKAARMRKMVYNCTIEENAMRHADKCKFVHSPESQRPGLGENLWAIWPVQNNFTAMAADSSYSWFSELKNAGIPPDNILNMALWNRPKMIGHYTQVVWGSTYQLGCAIKSCPAEGMTFVVCQYGPQGNWLDSVVYDIGDPCTTDADCKCSGCKCSQKEALCIMPYP